MPKPDPAHKETDKILRDMEKRLDEVYKQAYKEARQTADDFMKQFREMDKKKRQQVKDGELDKAEYERWRRTQVFQGNRYHQMADTLAADMTHTNQIAASVINGYLPEVYAVNHNYGTYEIEKGSRINTQYTMYDKQTVERLMRDNPDLLPRKAAVNVPKDQLWNKKHINSAITQGLLQGEPIDKIAQRLAATVTDMSHTSAIRNARTMTTSAQNGGRIDSYKRAESMGIKMMQVWLSTLDNRTRHEHILLDGQKRKVGEPFEVEGEKIFFPGDPAADPALVYNCRCTLVGEVEGVDYNLSDVSQRDNKLGDMTYEEWKEEKRKQDNAEPTAPKPEPKPKAEDKPVEVEMPAPMVEKPDAVDEPIKPHSEQYNSLTKGLEKEKIQVVETKPLESPLKEEEIINKLCGGDMTIGSCTSLAFAYTGNKGGIDVIDFRGGDSCKFFAKTANILQIAELDGVESTVIKHTNDFKATVDLLKTIKDDKEYILSTGEHTAVVRKAEKGFEYLELQSPTDNGFKHLGKEELKNRFNCKKSHSVHGVKLETKNVLIDRESLSQSDEFKQILKYINTEKENQKKGASGSAK